MTPLRLLALVLALSATNLFKISPSAQAALAAAACGEGTRGIVAVLEAAARGCVNAADCEGSKEGPVRVVGQGAVQRHAKQ